MDGHTFITGSSKNNVLYSLNQPFKKSGLLRAPTFGSNPTGTFIINCPYFNIIFFKSRSCHSSRNAKKYYNKRKPGGGTGEPGSEAASKKKLRNEAKAGGDTKPRKSKSKAKAKAAAK